MWIFTKKKNNRHEFPFKYSIFHVWSDSFVGLSMQFYAITHLLNRFPSFFACSPRQTCRCFCRNHMICDPSSADVKNQTIMWGVRTHTLSPETFMTHAGPILWWVLLMRPASGLTVHFLGDLEAKILLTFGKVIVLYGIFAWTLL